MRNFFVCLCIIAGMGSSWSFAFDNEQTHPLLTEKAVEQANDFNNFLKNQLNFENGAKEKNIPKKHWAATLLL